MPPKANPHFSLSLVERQVLIGSLLGDGNLNKPPKNKTPMFREKHCNRQGSYLAWKALLLTRLGPTLSSDCCVLRTRHLPNLLELEQKFYPQGKKVVPYELTQELNCLGLAIWYQDDGTYSQRYKWSRLATQGFTEEENRWLADNFFPQHFNLFPHARNRPSRPRYWELFFDKQSTMKLMSLIASFIQPCFAYKMRKEFKKSPDLETMRILAARLGHRNAEMTYNHYLKLVGTGQPDGTVEAN